MKILWPVIDLDKGDNQFVGIMIMAALLRRSGHHSEVVDAGYNRVRARMLEIEPDIVAFSTPSIYSRTYVELNRRLKREFKFYSVFGGPHPTFFPELIEEDGIDGVCIGEGEYPMLELVENLSRGDPAIGIKNWWIKEGGEIHRNPLRPLIRDLDRLPLPDHGIFRRSAPRSIWQAMVLTGRGCPYGCTYCYNHAYKALYRGKGRIIRRRSVDNVIAELQTVKRQKSYRFIRFLDDLFTLDPEWVREFSVRYRREIGLPFSCLVRANHVTPEIARDLKEAGCWRVTIGLEAGDEYLRNQILKRNMSDEEILNACRIIKEAGLRLVTGNILGIPGGSLEADFKTLELNIRTGTDFAGVNLLQPYPGTEIHRLAEEMGLLDRREGGMRESTVMRISSLCFRDEKEKQMVENLEKLFPITVGFPVIRPLVRWLIKLPPNKVFYLFLSGWVNYCHYFRAIPPRVGWRTIWKRTGIYHRLARLGETLTAKLKKPLPGNA